MVNILIDTHIFVKLFGEFKCVLDCILQCCDNIIYTNEIMKEYIIKSMPYGLFPKAFLDDLKIKGKSDFEGTSYINSRFEYRNNIRQYKFPSHYKDNKWIKTAVAVEAKYIITKDKHFNDLAPFRFDGDKTEVIDPLQYIKIRCGELESN